MLMVLHFQKCHLITTEMTGENRNQPNGCAVQVPTFGNGLAIFRKAQSFMTFCQVRRRTTVIVTPYRTRECVYACCYDTQRTLPLMIPGGKFTTAGTYGFYGLRFSEKKNLLLTTESSAQTITLCIIFPLPFCERIRQIDYHRRPPPRSAVQRQTSVTPTLTADNPNSRARIAETVVCVIDGVFETVETWLLFF